MRFPIESGFALLPAAWFVHHGLQGEKRSHLFPSGLGSCRCAPQMEVAAPRRDRAAAVPGVDGRWQEELVQGEGHSEPAPLRAAGISSTKYPPFLLQGAAMVLLVPIPG